VQRLFVADCLVPKRLPSNERDFGYQWWKSLEADIVRRKMKAAETLLTKPGIAVGEVVNLQKQILDLREQLHEFSEFSPARAADN